MAKTWLENKLDIYLEDVENDKTIRKGFNNIVEEASDQQVSDFSNAVASLYHFDKSHTVLNQSYTID